MLFRDFPEGSANLIRALLASSASVPMPARELLERIGAAEGGAVLRICGYGRPDLDAARMSDENRVVLIAESQLPFDNFHVFEVPVPEELLETEGTKRISVTLAFDPPVRHSRFDYLGTMMSFRLIRGCTIEEVREAFRWRGKDEPKPERITSTSCDCALSPGAQAREGSTLQKATFEWKRRRSVEYGDTYYLVARCEQKWARVEHAPQRYAVVVVIEHESQINLYAPISQRVRAAVRIRP